MHISRNLFFAWGVLLMPLLEWNLVGTDYECANFEEVKNKIDTIIKS